MAGCWAVMIVLGTLMQELGDHTPIIKDYLGGGAIVCIFGSALLSFFHILPAALEKAEDGTVTAWANFAHIDLVGNISTFFKPTGAFLDFYIAALICGSILGMNRKLLAKAAARYFPAIFGGIVLSFGISALLGGVMGFGVAKAILLIALPIMGGGMGAGAVPLSKIFESTGAMTATEAISIMTPAVAIGNAISIVMAGVLSKVLKSDKINGHGKLMVTGAADAAEYDISPEMKAKRDHLTVENMGIGLLVSCSFFALGYIIAKGWDTIVPSVSIHAYAWMIISVAVCKLLNIIPERIEIACYQWFQFIMKNLTSALLVGIGLCYLDIQQVIDSFSVTYLILCLGVCLGAFVGAAVIGKLVGFFPFEAGVTAGLCMANMGGTGDVAVMSAADRMELMPFSQISSRLGGAIILIIGSLLLSLFGGLL